jgi:pimeloyl-ACP methyl ester carboxylesterase
MHVTVNEVRLAYAASGDPGAAPVVLLHGGGSDRTTWEAVSADLCHDYRAYALDMRGFGGSGRPGQYSFELMRDDVIAFVDDLGLDQIVLIGHSMGGNVAWLVAQERPKFLSRLVIEDVVPPRVGDPAPSVPPRPDVPLPFDYDALALVMRQLGAPDPQWWDRLGLIDVPTLIIAGGSSSHIDQARLAHAAALVPDCRMVTVDIGHNVHRDALADFLKAVREFLGARSD